MDLEASLDAEIDEDVEFVFHIVNPGGEPLDLEFPTGQVADVVVYAGDQDDPVWRWSDDKAFTQAIERRTIEPEEALEQVYLWEDPPPGEYTAVASLEVADGPEASTAIRIS